VERLGKAVQRPPVSCGSCGQLTPTSDLALAGRQRPPSASPSLTDAASVAFFGWRRLLG
jgi:hypothetical protein